MCCILLESKFSVLIYNSTTVFHTMAYLNEIHRHAVATLNLEHSNIPSPSLNVLMICQWILMNSKSIQNVHDFHNYRIHYSKILSVLRQEVKMLSLSYHPHPQEAWPAQPCQLSGMWYQQHDTQTCEWSRENQLSENTVQALNGPGSRTAGSHNSLEYLPDTLCDQSEALQAENNMQL